MGNSTTSKEIWAGIGMFISIIIIIFGIFILTKMPEKATNSNAQQQAVIDATYFANFGSQQATGLLLLGFGMFGFAFFGMNLSSEPINVVIASPHINSQED